MLREEWLRDPKHVGFVLARFTFVSKMLAGLNRVLEVGAGDGLASEIVQREVGELTLTDRSPRGDGVLEHDILGGPVDPGGFDAAFCLDVIEHIEPGLTWTFLENMADSLRAKGLVIVGAPSIESLPYASAPARREHVNCMSQEHLRAQMRKHFDPVLMLGQNDSVIHTGHPRFLHYLWALGVK